MSATSVLLVEHNPVVRSTIGLWLEGAGYDVIQCPGPIEPDYGCFGARGGLCPLMDPCDIVVLDLRLGSDDAMVGVPGWQLFHYYLAQGRAVVAIGGAEDAIHPFPAADVTVVRRPPARDELLAAVGRLSRRKAG